MADWDFSNVPEELRALDQWVLWRLLPGEGRNGKPRKVPFAVDGSAAKSTDPTTWSSFDKVVRAYMADDEAAGIGFVFTQHDPFIGVDIDGCVKDGELSPDAKEVMERLGTYTELSPSMTGLHMIGKLEGDWPFGGKKKAGYEVYRTARYFTFTGRQLGINGIVPVDEPLKALATVWFGTDPNPESENELPGKHHARAMTDREHKHLAEALAHLDPTDEPTWFRMTCALHSTGDQRAFELWDRWSRGEFDPSVDTANGDVHPSYNPESNLAYWQRLGKTPPGDLEHGYATVSTIFAEAKNNGWAGFPPELFDEPVSVLRTMDLVFSRPPQREYLVENLIPAGKVGALVAPGGVGKSYATLGLAVALATGEPAFNNPAWAIKKPGSVLILNAEDERDELARRLYSAVSLVDQWHSFDDGYDGLAMRTTVGASIHYRYIGGDPMPLSNGREISANVQRLAEYVRGIKDLRLIILDPANVFDHGDENAANERNVFVQALRRLARETGVAIAIVHHANKASIREDGAGSSVAARGSSALIDGVRWAINLAVMNERQANDFGIHPEDRGNYVALYLSKANYAPPAAIRWLRRSPAGLGGALEYVDMDEVRAQNEQREGKELALAVANVLAVGPGDEFTAALTSIRDQLLDEYRGPFSQERIGKAALEKRIKRQLENGIEITRDDDRVWLVYVEHHEDNKPAWVVSMKEQKQ